MPQIPLYTESVQRTTQEPIQQDNATGAAVGRALSGVGGAVFEVGAKVGEQQKRYAERKRELKENSDISDYEVLQQSFETDLEEKKNDAMINGGVGYADLYEKVVVPEMSKFNDELMTRGYSETALSEISRRWNVDQAKIRNNEIVQREKMELTDYAERIKEQAFGLINNGDTESGYELLESLNDVVGTEQVNQWKSLGIYNRNVNEMYSITDPNEIEEFANSKEAKSMNPAQYQQFRTLADNRVKKMTADIYAPAKKEAEKQVKDAQATEDSIRELGLPKAEEDLYLGRLAQSIKNYETVNEEVVDGLYMEVDKFLGGNYSGIGSAKEYDNLLKKLEDAELPDSVFYEIMKPIINSQERPGGNVGFFTNQKEFNSYDQGENRLLKEYRNAFNASNAGLEATQAVYGFSNGYRMVMDFAKRNKKAIESGEEVEGERDMIKLAVMPTLERRMQIQSRKNGARAIRTAPIKLDKKQFDEFWSE